MGWKGTLRSLSALARAAERDAQRRHKQAIKEQVSDEASHAVAVWEDYIANLTSIHTDLTDAINWRDLASKIEPAEPTFKSVHEENAIAERTAFKPSVFDLLKGGSKRQEAKLEAAIVLGKKKDSDNFRNAQIEYASAMAEWQTDAGLAKRILNGEAEAIKEVIKEIQSFVQEGLIGSAVSFKVEDNFIHAIPEIHTDEIVPQIRRKQLASGRLSETKMPTGQFNELYQDYVASVALKIAGDIFHIVPFDEIYVTCVVTMLNSKTGHHELTPILSVMFVRSTMMKLNLERIDPSDSMKNFKHSMNFKKTTGFKAVEPLVSIH